MNAAEAQRVLRNNNYCLTHLEPMVERKSNNPYANAAYGAQDTYYACPKCEAQKKAKNDADLTEALEIFKKARIARHV